MGGDEGHEPGLSRVTPDDPVFVACSCGRWAEGPFGSYHDALERHGKHRRFPNKGQVERTVNKAAAAWCESVQRALAAAATQPPAQPL